MQSKEYSNKDLSKKLMNKAIFYLSKYASHSKKLKEILSNYINKNNIVISVSLKNELINDTIKKCQDFGYLDDELYAQNKTKKMYLNGKSKKLTLLNLIMLGIEKEIALKAINDVYGNDIESNYRSALNFIKRKKIGLIFSVNENKYNLNFERWMAMMSRAGYDYNLSNKILNIKNIEELN